MIEKKRHLDLNAMRLAIAADRKKREAYAPADREAVRRAAVRMRFDPQEIEDEGDRAYLNEKASVVGELSDRSRRELLGQLAARGVLKETYARHVSPAEEAENPIQRMLGRLIRNEETNTEQLTAPELNGLRRAIFWVQDFSAAADGNALAEIDAELRRRNLLAQFEAHTQHFRGREAELTKLREYVFSKSPADGLKTKAPLLIYGIGGIGKSTLVSQFILTERLVSGRKQTLFVYLDFDRVGLSVEQPLALVQEGLQQIMLQLPTTEGIDPDLLSAADGLDYTLQNLREAAYTKASKVSRQDSRYVIEQLLERHLREKAGRIKARFESIVVVLDSFEEAQSRATETDLRSLLGVIDQLATAIPPLRLLIVGRSDLVVAPFAFEPLEVGDFDEPAAVGYLTSRAVAEPLAREIFARVGGNPLNLKLAARLAAQGEGFLEKLEEESVREQLVRRNLDHIRDEEVSKIVEPGLLLRRIDPAVIREVLAVPCGLGRITKEYAEELFRRLQRVTFLIEKREGEIYFRRDLRIALGKKIWARTEQPGELPAAAVAYYRGKAEPRFRAEWIYHRLQIEQDFGFLDDIPHREREDLRPFLENAGPELPEAAAAALGRWYAAPATSSAADGSTTPEPPRPAEVAGELERLREGFRDGEELPILTQRWDALRSLVLPDTHGLDYLWMGVRLGRSAELFRDYAVEIGEGIGDARYHYLMMMHGNYSEGGESTSPGSVAGITFRLRDWYQLVDTVSWSIKNAARARQATSFASITQQLDPQFVKEQLALRDDGKIVSHPQRFRGTNWSPVDYLADPGNFPGGVRAIYKSLQLDTKMAPLVDAYHDHWPAYEDLVAVIRDADDKLLRLVFDNVCKRLPSQIAQPGTPRVVATDLADFLVAFYQGNWTEIDEFKQRIEAPVGSAAPRPLTTAPQKDEIVKLLQSGRLQEATQLSLRLMEELGDEDKISQVTQLQAAVDRALKQNMQGTTLDDELQKQQDRMTMNMLDILNSLDKS